MNQWTDFPVLLLLSPLAPLRVQLVDDQSLPDLGLVAKERTDGFTFRVLALPDRENSSIRMVREATGVTSRSCNLLSLSCHIERQVRAPFR